MNSQSIEIIVCDKAYTIRTTNEPEYTKALAQKLNEKFLQIFASDSNASLLDAAVLSGLDILDELTHAQANAQRARNRAKEYAQELTRQIKETRKVQEEKQALLEENQQLKTELEMLRLKDSIETK